jgi:outer membrane receptor protein involved in Fe transport
MVKLRGSFQQAVRAANVIEMFQAQGLQLFGMTSDPCSGPSPTATAAQCARSGLTAAQYGGVLLTSPAAQYNSLAGGNPALEPETAKTYTAGIVLTPMRNFSATIDYFNIKVEDVIGVLPPNLVVTQCIFSGQFCDLVHRGLGGTLWSDPSGFVTATNINIAKLKTSGWDIAINYNYNVGRYGGLGFSFIGTKLDKLSTEPIPGLGEYDCVGFHGGTCGTPTPEWRHKFRVVWSAPWKFDLATTWRHVGKVKIDTLNSSPLLQDLAATAPITENVGARDYFDLALTFNVLKQVSIRAGVNNVFDRDPPTFNSSGGQAVVFGNGNTYPQVYDCCGRKFFVGTTINF